MAQGYVLMCAPALLLTSFKSCVRAYLCSQVWVFVGVYACVRMCARVWVRGSGRSFCSQGCAFRRWSGV